MFKITDITVKIGCWYCSREMYFNIFKTCFGEMVEFYECSGCHFTLDKVYVEKFGPQRPTAA